MCLELCKKSLRSLLSVKMSEITVLTYAYQICDAMEYVHSKGVVHLDLKPENVLIVSDGNLRIIDFEESLLAPQR